MSVLIFLMFKINAVENIKKQIAAINWVQVADGLNKKGFALVPGFLDDESCGHLLQNYEIRTLYRKTIVMERYRFGLGEYKYFSYPLPGLLQTIREEVYARVWPVANEWMDMLGIAKKFPASLDALREDCFSKGQPEPAVLILKYGKDGHNTLHQDLYGEVFFPLQLVIFLNEPGTDYTGGEFVLLQQTPRAQSKAIVLQPGRGDMLLFATRFRPVKGSKGYYRAQMKHGVSELHTGERHTVGIIFHDAKS